MSYKTYDNYKDSKLKWLGVVPHMWELERLGFHSKIITGHPFNSDLFSIEGIPLIRIRDLKEKDTSLFWNSEYPEYAIVNKGDLLVGMDGDFDVVSWNGNKALLNQRIFKINAKNKITNNYLKYILQIPITYINELTMSTTVKHLSVKDVNDIIIPIPSYEEQEKIANYLDNKTAKIDATIAKNEELIRLLEEKRVALINQVVTKGLNPDVPMKDSGVEWIGEIPEHWECRKINTLSSVSRGASPRPIDDPIYFDENGEYSWVRISDVTSSNKYLEQTTEKLSTLGKSLSVPIEPGNIFVSIAATVGKPIIANIKCCIHDGFVYFKNLELNDEYLFYIFAGGEAYKGLGKLGTQLNLNTETIGKIHIPVPPKDEQADIINYLDYEIEKVDKTISKVQENINLLNEYKTSLIHHVVTGKIDVRGEEI